MSLRPEPTFRVCLFQKSLFSFSFFFCFSVSGPRAPRQNTCPSICQLRVTDLATVLSMPPVSTVRCIDACTSTFLMALALPAAAPSPVSALTPPTPSQCCFPSLILTQLGNQVCITLIMSMLNNYLITLVKQF